MEVTQPTVLVIAYDIAQDARRADVSAVLAGIGARVQLSIFEIEVHQNETKTLLNRLRELIDPAEDQIRVWQLTPEQARSTTILGRRRLEERSDFVII